MKISNNINPLDIAISGMRAQNRSMEAISSNIANARTTDAGKGEPYRRLETKFKLDGDQLGPVKVEKLAEDQGEFKYVLNPGHPDADKSGYVAMPNVSMPVELMNMTVATRAYEANAAIMKRYQRMVESTLELLR